MREEKFFKKFYKSEICFFKGNVDFLINKYFNDYVIKILRKIGIFATSIGKETYLVGGAVRDLFLERASLDLDIVFEGDFRKLIVFFFRII